MLCTMIDYTESDDDPGATRGLIVNSPPPAPRVNRSKHAPALAAARKVPGVWCQLEGEYSAALGSQIRHGRIAGLEPGEFEVATRAIKGRTRRRIFIRYVGDGTVVDPRDVPPR